MYAFILCALLGASPPPLHPTPAMRIESVYQDMERNRAVRVIPGSLPYPYPALPSYPTPFSDRQSPFIQSYYSPYYSPYYYHYWR